MKQYDIDPSTLPACIKIIDTRNTATFTQWDITAYGIPAFTQWEVTAYGIPASITLYGEAAWGMYVIVDALDYGRVNVGPFMDGAIAVRGATQALLDLVDPLNERGA